MISFAGSPLVVTSEDIDADEILLFGVDGGKVLVLYNKELHWISIEKVRVEGMYVSELVEAAELVSDGDDEG